MSAETSSVNNNDLVEIKTAPPLAKTKPEVAPSHPICDSLTRFLNGIYGVQQSFTVLMPHIHSWVKDENRSLLEKYKRYAKGGESNRYSFDLTSARQIADMMAFRRSAEMLGAVKYAEVIAQSLFTQVFCEFDSYMGGLLKALYSSKPELFSTLDRKLSISELKAYGSVDAATDAMLEAEIDAFRRSSYVEQFGSLESRFNLPLKKFAEWGEFVELGQRRNLLIHNGGIVNEQYRVMCGKEGHNEAKTTPLGTRLSIDTAYLSRALLIMRKVSFMLAHTLWRKVLPEQTDQAHVSCDKIIYDLLQKKLWLTAAELGEFALQPQLCKNLTEQYRKMRVINTAIGYRFSKQQSHCDRVIDAEDWSSTIRDFRLAVALMKGDLEAGWNIMRQIGPRGELIDEVAYRDWPLFHEIRLEPDFHVAFEEIYGESFAAQLTGGTPTAVALPDSQPVLESKPAPPLRRAKKVINRSSLMNPASIPGTPTKSARVKPNKSSAK